MTLRNFVTVVGGSGQDCSNQVSGWSLGPPEYYEGVFTRQTSLIDNVISVLDHPAKKKCRKLEANIPRITINVPVVYMVRYKVVLRGDYP